MQTDSPNFETAILELIEEIIQNTLLGMSKFLSL